MRPCWLLLFAALVLSVVGSAQVVEHSDSESTVASTPHSDRQQEPRELTPVVDQIIAQSQEFRRQHGLGDVEANGQLMQTSQYFAQYMAETNQYGHQADGRRPSERAKAYGYEYCIVSENIAYLFSSEPIVDEELARRFVDGWKNSPEHRKNLLEPAVIHIGAAVAQSSENGYYFAVQMFGRPESAAIQFELSNETQQVLRYRFGEQALELPPGYTRVHKRCRPGEFCLIPADEEEQDRLSFVPQSGDRLVVVEGPRGQLEIEHREAEAQQDAPGSEAVSTRSDNEGEAR